MDKLLFSKLLTLKADASSSDDVGVGGVGRLSSVYKSYSSEVSSESSSLWLEDMNNPSAEFVKDFKAPFSLGAANDAATLNIVPGLEIIVPNTLESVKNPIKNCIKWS